MTRLILPICIISLLSGCQDANPAEREWKEQLYKNLAIVGARNWIVIAESSFPAYTGTGIRTMVSDKTSDEVLLDVLNMLEEEAHVVPRIMISSELRSITEDYAPGIKRYRNNINKMLPGRQHFELMSRTINSLIEDAARQFNVLVIKTKTSLPYSNIYIELDSGYSASLWKPGTPPTAARPRTECWTCPWFREPRLRHRAARKIRQCRELPPPPRTTCRSSRGKTANRLPPPETRPPACLRLPSGILWEGKPPLPDFHEPSYGQGYRRTPPRRGMGRGRHFGVVRQGMDSGGGRSDQRQAFRRIHQQ